MGWAALMTLLLSVMSLGGTGLTVMLNGWSKVSPSVSTTWTPMGMLVTVPTENTVLVAMVLPPVTVNRPAFGPVRVYVNVWLGFGSVVVRLPTVVPMGCVA